MWALGILCMLIGVAVIIVCILEHPTTILNRFIPQSSPTEKIQQKEVVVSPLARKPSPFDRFGIVYYINLDHRIDRRQEIEAELDSMSVDPQMIQRIPGVIAEAHKGAIGCTMAHMNALKHFTEDTDYETCVVLEDDFQFLVKEQQLAQSFEAFFNEIVYWDVVLLAGRMKITTNEPRNSCHRVHDVSTTSGYIVNRKFAHTLLQNYSEGLEKLTRKYDLHRYAIDEYWKRIQEANKWYALKPLSGTQRESFSDINQCVKEVKSTVRSYPVV